jgi:16S rRNA (cytosine1402-N4)-methyltransferase
MSISSHSTAQKDKDKARGHGRVHEPVMAREVVQILSAHRPLRIVDATVGTGGHAAALLEAAPTAACLLGIDRDCAALAVAAQTLARFGSRVILHHGDFTELTIALERAGFLEIDVLLADLGMSSFALDNPARGLSLKLDGPLDMRMDQNSAISAADLVNHLSEAELARIIWAYGQEPAARRIARAIVSVRRRHPLTTTTELRRVVERARGRARHSRIHPATRTFQALRIAVNGEMEQLSWLLKKVPALLSAGGRMALIAYHSLEDRPIKKRFLELAASGGFTMPAGRLLRPGAAEVGRNPRARSARLRCLERIAL